LLVAVANPEETVLPPTVELADTVRIELDPVRKGSSVEFAEGIGNAADTLEFADAVGTNSDAVPPTLVPDQRVILAVGIGISPEPPLDRDLEKDPARSLSEILPIVFADSAEVAFAEAGGTVTEAVAISSVPESVTLVVLDRLNEPVRSWSELVNAGPVVVALRLRLRVRLGGSEIVVLAEGKTTPVPWLIDVTAVPPDVEKIAAPDEPGPVTFTLRVGVTLGRAGIEEFPDGITTSVSAVAESTEVSPAVVNTPVPAEIVTLILRLGIRLAEAVAGPLDDIAPEPPVADVIAVPPELLKLAAPLAERLATAVPFEDSVTASDANGKDSVGDGTTVPKPPAEFAVLTPPLTVPIKSPDVALGRVTFGVIGIGVTAPPPPVEKKTEVFPPILSCAEPEMIASEAGTERLGTPVPAPPVKLEVDVAPPTVSTWLPDMTNCVPIVGRGTLELEVLLADAEGSRLPVPWPLPPVAFAVKVDPEVAKSAPPDVAGRPIEMGKLSCAELVGLPYPPPPAVELDVAVDKA
jgi:hypothetical protein